MNTNRIATGSSWKSKRLLAALAVLAVAFVVLAAVPAVATDSDAEETTSESPGFIAAGAIADKDAAQSVVKALGSTRTDIPANLIFVEFYYKTTTEDVSLTITQGKNTFSLAANELNFKGASAGAHWIYTTTETVDGWYNIGTGSWTFDASSAYKLVLTIGSTSYTKNVTPGNFYLYKDYSVANKTLSSGDTLTIPAGTSLTVISAGAIDVVSGATLTVESGASLIIKDTKFKVEGTLDVKGTLEIAEDGTKKATNFYQRMAGLTGTITLEKGSDLVLKGSTLSFASATGSVKTESNITTISVLTGGATVDGDLEIAGVDLKEYGMVLDVAKGATLTIPSGAEVDLTKAFSSSDASLITGIIVNGTVAVKDGGVLNVDSKLSGSGSIEAEAADGLILRESTQLFDYTNSTWSAIAPTMKIASSTVGVYAVQGKAVSTDSSSTSTSGSGTGADPIKFYETYEAAVSQAEKDKVKYAIIIEPLAFGAGWTGDNTVSPTVTAVDLSKTTFSSLVGLTLISNNNNKLGTGGTETKVPMVALTGDVDLSGSLKSLYLAGIALSKADVTEPKGSAATITSTGWTTRLAAGSIAVDWDGASNEITIDDATGTVRITATAIGNLTVTGDGKDKTTVVFENAATITGKVDIKSSTVQSEGTLTLKDTGSGDNKTGSTLTIDKDSSVTGTLSVNVAGEKSTLGISEADTSAATVTVSSDVAVDISLPKGSSYVVDSDNGISLYANDNSVITYDSSKKALTVTSGSVSVVGGKLAVKALTVTTGTFSGRIDAADDLTIDGAGTVSSNIDLAAGKTLTLKSGITYSGTVKYLANSLVLTGAKLGADSTIKAVAATTGADAVAAHLEVAGTFNAADSSATVVLNGNATLSGATVVGKNVVLTISTGAVLTVPATISSNNSTTSEKILSGDGKVSVAGTLDIQALDAAKAVALHVDVVTGGSVSYAKNATSELSDVTYDTESVKTVNIAGGEIQNASYGAAQRVEVTADTTVTGTLEISGILHINSGVTLTVASTGSVVLQNAGVSVIDGTLVLQGTSSQDADLTITDSAVLNVNGGLTVAGDLIVNKSGSIVFKQGSTSTVGGSLEAAKVVVEDSASLTVTGSINNVPAATTGAESTPSAFQVAGTLTINSSEVSDAFSVTLTSASAVVDIEKVTTKAESTQITVKDQGSYGTSKVTTTKSGYNFKDKANEIDITLSGAMPMNNNSAVTQITGATSVVVLTGVQISESTSAKKLTDDEKKTYSSIDTYTMVLSGTMAVAGQVVYSGTETTYPVDPSAAVVIKGNTAAAIGETSFGTNFAVTSSGALSVTGAVSLPASTSRAASETSGHAYVAKTYSTSLILGSSTSDKVSVKAAVTVGAGATLESKGTTTVSAAVDATAQVTSSGTAATFTNSGVLKLNGSGSVKVLGRDNTNAPITSNVNGAAYYTNAGTTTTPIHVWNYVTIDTAIAALVANTTTAVTLYGENVLAASAEIPNGSTVALASDATLKVGKDSEATEVVLNIADGARLNGASNVITVYGTLYAAKVTDITSSLRAAVVSDVSSYATTASGAQDNTSWAKWTNLATALDDAVSGERIVISGSDRIIDLAANATVKEGVTLDLNGNILAVEQKYTLTVAGTLDLTDGGLLYLADSTVDSETKKTTAAAGSVSYTGYIQYDTDAVSGSVKIATMTKTSSSTTWAIPTSANTTLVLPGAYYSVETSGIQYNILTSYANGAANAQSAVADATTGVSVSLVADKDGAVSLGEISFAGTAKAPVLIAAYGDVSGTITLSYAQFFVGYMTGDIAGYKIDAVFNNAEGAVAGSIQVKGTTGTSSVSESGITYKWGFNVTAGDYPAGATDAKQVIGFGGSLTDSDYKDDSGKTVKVSTALEITGTVYAMSYVDIDVDKVSVTGSLVLTGEDGKTGTTGAEIATLDVTDTGSLAIDAGSELTVTALTVSGSVVINDGSLIATTAEVTGSIDASAVDDDNLSIASMTVGKLYIGIAAKKITGADASVTGNVAISDATGYAVKAAGATAPSAWADSDKYKSTVYSVDDSQYVTVYVLSTSALTIDTVKAPAVENATFQYWQVGTTDASSHYIGESGYTAVTAKIKTDIYTVTINADGGVNYITLNGKLMTNPNGNEFTLSGLTADTYTVVVSPKTGYDTSKVALYDSTSAAVGSMEITLSGTETTSFTYSLIGSTASSSGTSGGISSDDIKSITDAINKNTEEIKNKDVTISGGSDDDNDLTNILLVVLVILIIVMAILVAMRMMRS